MGIGSSTLGAPTGAWRNTSHTPATAEHLAPPGEDFDPGQPDAPVTVAEVHAFLEQRADRWRAPDPAALPTRWPVTAFHLLANVTGTVQQIRHAPTVGRLVRSAPAAGGNASQVQPTGQTSEHGPLAVDGAPGPHLRGFSDAVADPLNRDVSWEEFQATAADWSFAASGATSQNPDADFFVAVGGLTIQALSGRPMSPDEEQKISAVVAEELDQARTEQGPRNRGDRYIVTDSFDRPLERYFQRIKIEMVKPPTGTLFKKTGQLLKNPATEFSLAIGNVVTQLAYGRPPTTVEEQVIRGVGGLVDMGLDAGFAPARVAHAEGTVLDVAGQAIDGDEITPESIIESIQGINLQGLERGLHKPTVVRPGKPPLAAGLPSLAGYQVELGARLQNPDHRGMGTFDGKHYVEIDGAHYPIRHTGQRHQWKIYKGGHDPDQAGIVIHYNRKIGAWQELVPADATVQTSAHQHTAWSPQPDTPAADHAFQFHYQNNAWVVNARKATLHGIQYAYVEHLGRLYRQVCVEPATADARTVELDVLTEPVSMPDGSTRWQVIGEDGKQLAQHVSFLERSNDEAVLKMDEPVQQAERWAIWTPQPGTPAAAPEFQFHYQDAAWVTGLPEVTHDGIPYAYARSLGQYYRKAHVLVSMADGRQAEFAVLTEPVAQPDGTRQFQVVGKNGKPLSEYVWFSKSSKTAGVLGSDRPAAAVHVWRSWSPKPDTPAANPAFQLHYQDPEWMATAYEFTPGDGESYVYVPHLRQNYRKVRVQCETADAGPVGLDVLTHPVAMPDGALRWQVIGRDGQNLPEHVSFSAGRTNEGVLESDRPAPAHDPQQRKAMLEGYAVEPESPLPAPDSDGIRSAHGRDYIEIDGRYYPVGRQPGDAVLRIHKPGRLLSAWSIPVRRNGQGEWETFSLGLKGGAAVPVSREQLGLIDRRIEHIAHQPEKRQLIAFNNAADEIETLVPEQQLDRLDLLINQIRHVPERERSAAFKRAASAADKLVDHHQRAGRFTALAHRLSRLAEADRWEAFELMAGKADDLTQPYNALLALATQIEVMPRPDSGAYAVSRPVDRRWDALNLVAEHVLDPKSGLTRDQRAELVGALEKRIDHLAYGNDRWAAYKRFATAADGTPAQCYEVLHRLPGRIKYMPREKWPEAYDLVSEPSLALAKRLTGPRLANLLEELAEPVKMLPADRQWKAFKSIVDATPLSLPDQHRVLIALEKQIGFLPRNLHGKAFGKLAERVSEATPVLAPDDRRVLLTVLARGTKRLPGAEQWPAFEHISDQVDATLPSPHGVLEEFRTQIRFLPRERRAQGFARVVERVSDPAFDLTLEQRTDLLISLVPLIERLPDDQRWLAIDSVAEANDVVAPRGLDVPLALEGQLDVVPASRQWEAYERLTKIASAAVDAPAAQYRALRKALIRRIGSLPPQHRWDAFRLGTGARRGPTGAPVQLPHEILLELTNQVESMPPGDRWPAFQRVADRISDATPGLTVPQRVEQWRQLMPQLGRLPTHMRLPAFKRIAAASNALQEPELLPELIKRADTLPADAQVEAFDYAAEATDAFAGQMRAELLNELTNRLPFLPDDARWEGFQRIVRMAVPLTKPQLEQLFIRLRRRIVSLATDEQRQWAYDLIDPTLKGVREPDQPAPVAAPDQFHHVSAHDPQQRKAMLEGYAVEPESPLPAPDSDGISSAHGQDYIEIDGRYYPVGRQPGDPTLRIHKPGRLLSARSIPVRRNVLGEWETFSLGLKGGQPDSSFTLPARYIDVEGDLFSITHQKAGTREAARAASSNWETELEAVLTPAKWKSSADELLENPAYIASYRHAFDRLPTGQRRAIREWTYNEEIERYATSPQVSDSINYDLNEALRGEAPVTAEHKRVYVNLREGLDRLPSAGDTTLLRIADVKSDYLQQIQVNDIVTNTPSFMSASSSGDFADSAIADQSAALGTVSGQPDAMLAFYVIDGKTAKPFVDQVSTLADGEREWLFPPDTLFKVDAISTARPIAQKEKTRLVIRLKEIEHPRDQASSVAKNIHTGERTVVRRPAYWSPQPGIPAADPEFLFDYQYADWVEDLPDVTRRISGDGIYVHHRGEDYRKATLLLDTADRRTIYLHVLTKPVSMPDGTIRWQVIGQDGRQLPHYVTFGRHSPFVGTLHIEARAAASHG